MNALLTTDTLAALGDARGALRGLWADIAQEQGTGLESQAVAHYMRPDTFAAVRRVPVLLKRTFNQPWPDGRVIKYWRVMSAWHTNAGSDLSLDGLKQWGII
jgi:hypothetical protein